MKAVYGVAFSAYDTLQVLLKLDEKRGVPHLQHSGMTCTPRASLIIAAPALAGNPVTFLLPPGASKSVLLSHVREYGM